MMILPLASLPAGISQIAVGAENGSSPPAHHEYLDWDDIGSCYSPNWIYDPIDPVLNVCPGTEPSFNIGPTEDLFEEKLHHDPYRSVWYCQARPACAPGFTLRRFHSYQEKRGNARDQALHRCESSTGKRCASRCALMSGACAPHFWE
jgi:hypothetical protein